MTTVCASSDIHSPRHLELFKKALEESRCDPDVFVLAGDIVERNNIAEYGRVLSLLKTRHPGTPIVAVFGNEEYRGFEKEYMEKYRDVVFLNDSYRILEARGSRLVVVGSRGALDKPTKWQEKNLPGLARYYSELPARLSELLSEASSTHLPILLVTHYGVTHRNLIGENPAVYPYLASVKMEEVIVRHSGLLKAVIHGHAHNGAVESVEVSGVKVYNVALPARGRIVEVEV